jgi:hypothetical protein
MQYPSPLNLKIPAGLFCLGFLLILAGQPAQAVPNGGYAHPETIIQPEELKSLIDRKDPNIRIIDVLCPSWQDIRGGSRMAADTRTNNILSRG